MISRPPKAFLDTQIISEVERGHIAPEDWQCVSGYLRHASRYCISALTLSELLAGLANADPQYFENHKRRLRILLSPCPDAEVFDFIRYYVARELGLAIQRPPHLEDDFLGKVGLILSAESKNALLDGLPLPGEPGQTVKIRIDRFMRELEENRTSYLKIMGYRRGCEVPKLSPHDWAFHLLRFYGTSGDANTLAQVAERLSAAYEFEMTVNRLVRNPNYSLAKHASDLFDGQQLCYLCDANVLFITKDSDFKIRAGRSPQAKQIRTFAEVLASASSRSPLL